MAIGRNKLKTSVALDPALLTWVGEMVKKKYFASTSHAVEFSLQRQKDRQERGEAFGKAVKHKVTKMSWVLDPDSLVELRGCQDCRDYSCGVFDC